MSQEKRIEEDVEKESSLEDDTTEKENSAIIKNELKSNENNKGSISNIMVESEQINEKYGHKEQTQALPGIEKDLNVGSNIKDAVEEEKPNAIIMAEGLKKIESKTKTKLGDGSAIAAEDR